MFFCPTFGGHIILKYLRTLTKVFVCTYDFEESSILGAKTLGGLKMVSLC